MVESMLPRLMHIIYEINSKFLEVRLINSPMHSFMQNDSSIIHIPYKGLMPSSILRVETSIFSYLCNVIRSCYTVAGRKCKRSFQVTRTEYRGCHSSTRRTGRRWSWLTCASSVVTASTVSQRYIRLS